jgi:poly-gamma-glutamate synthesis protein (capsule biosynthesis protein)
MKYLFLIFLFTLPFSCFAQAWQWQTPADDADAISVILMGDMNIQDREDPAEGFQYILPTLQAADLRFANLEGAFAGTDRSNTWGDVAHKFAWRHSEPEMVEGLVAAGFDVVGVANNVTYPYTALQKSLKVLDEAGIQHTGGGDNLEEAHQPVIIERKGTKVGFLQYACTVFPFDHAAQANQPGIAEVKVHTSYQPPANLDKPAQPPIVVSTPEAASLARMEADIKQLKTEADVVVVSYHWGVSNTYEPVDYQRTIARAAIDSGADVILGHGPHKIQAVEMWNERPIFFSVGNGLFDWWKGRKSPDGLMVRLLIDEKELQEVSFIPLRRDKDNNAHLHTPNSDIGADIIQKITNDQSLHRARIRMVSDEVVVYDADYKERVPKLEKLWETTGLNFPESAVYDAKRKLVYIGNMGDMSKNGDGFITTMTTDGKIVDRTWVSGIDNPKGMALHENTLYVNDDQKIHKIDVNSGKIIKTIRPEGAAGLNDIAVGKDGVVFSNDADGNQTFVLKNDKAYIFWQDRYKGRPNGVASEADRLLIATSNSGQFLAVDKVNRDTRIVATGIGRGDGIEAVGNGDYLITDYSGRIFYLSSTEQLYTLLDSRDQKKTADLEYIPAQNMLIVPSHRNNTVQAFRLVWE